jgi:hypothetical protein
MLPAEPTNCCSIVNQLQAQEINRQLDQVIAINNEGARCLVSGRPLVAIRLIRRSMQILKNIHQDCCTDAVEFSGCDKEPLSPSSLPAATTTAPPSWTAFARTAMHIDDPAPEAGCGPKLQNEMYFVYTRPLVLPFWLALATPDDFETSLLNCSVYLIFNLALASQYYGLVSGTDAPLRQAMTLYNMCATTLCESIPIDNVLGMDGALLHCLVLNNLACLKFECCEYDESEHCVRNMHRLMAQTECFNNDTVGYFLRPHEAGELKINGLILQRPKVARAA